MLLGYNIILHWPVIPINIFIVVKEISMEWFRFMSDDVTIEAVNESPALDLVEDTEGIFYDILFYANPLTYVDYVWQLCIGKNVEDYFK